MVYEKNLKALESSCGDIYSKIVENKVSCCDERVIIENAKNGEKILKYIENSKEYYFNSKYNPTNEAEKFMSDEISMPDESVCTIFGLSNGSFAREYVTKNKKNNMCIIYEPSIDIFMQVIKHIDISDVILSDKVILVVKGINDELFNYSLSRLVQIHNVKTNKHIMLPKYGELFAEDLDYINKALNEQYDRVSAEANTVTTHGARTCRNSIYNMKFLSGCRSGRDYVEHFPKDMPVIIVSAGPSLEKNIDLLREAKGKALILVVDTAIPKVMNRGIIPDMIISVDYVKSLRHFKVKDIEDIPFIANIDTNYDVLNYVKPKHLVFDSADSVVWAKLFEKVNSEIYQVDEGGSVSTAAIAHMMAWGFKRIILVGQDLALTGNKVHADEEISDVEKLPWPTTYVKGIDGSDVLTRKDYCIYIRWIEDIAYKYPDIEIIDASEGGALKQNTKIMTLRDVIDIYCTTEYDIKSMILDVPRRFEGKDTDYIFEALDSMKRNLRNLRKQLKVGSADCHKGSLLLSRNEFDINELKRINSSIGRLDEKLMSSDEQIYLAKFVSKADVDLADDMYLEEEDDIKESIRMYEKSEKYYQTIADAIPSVIEIIDKCIAMLQEEYE